MAWAEAELAADEEWEAFRPRRGRCEACAGTQMLLPVSLLPRRVDAAVVIVSAIEARAAGARPGDIADDLGRPEGTVRGWLSAFRKLAGTWRRVFTSLAGAVAPAAAALAGVAGRPVLAEAVAAAAALTAALARAGTPGVSRWKVAVAASGGLLIAPPRLAAAINTNPSFQMIF
jgi:hypothetical protein